MTRMTATLLSLFILLIPLSASSQMSRETREHTEWIAERLREMNTIEVGMTRGELLSIFMTEGGLSTRLMRTYVNRRCPYMKVDVEFEPVGRPAYDAEGRVTLVESDEDLITQLSEPYLAWIVAD